MSAASRVFSLYLWGHKGYRLLDEAASGGMSTIYKAKSRERPEPVAIKILFPHYGEHKRKLQKLFSEKHVEGEMACSLSHPNVVKTYSYGRLRNRYYFVMEYVDGMNLKDLLSYKPNMIRGKKLDVIKEVAEGLAYIHSRGIVHRDVCAKNILVSHNGEVKIIDFSLSISKLSRYKGLGERSGTPSYMAPEQVRAQSSDERTDIYSFGVTVYEIIAERAPFGGVDTYARMQHHLSHEAVPLSKKVPNVPVSLENIVSKAMQKDPADRYASMQQLLKELKKVEFEGAPL